MSVYHIGFIMEQALGHVTHTRNLQSHVGAFPDVQARWGLVPYEVGGVAARLPLYGSNWTVRAGLRARAAVASLARGAPLDALLFHTQVPAVLAADWVRRIPSVISLDATPRQIDALGAAYGHAASPGPVERVKWQLTRRCLRSARRLVTWSAWARDGLVEEYDIPADMVTVIPPGVTPADWAPPAPRSGDAPARILFVGADLRRKGGDLLLRAFRALRPLGVTLHLVTRSEVAEEPGVFVYRTMQPNSPELRALYHSCDIFCLPTAGDCLPMVLSEAGAAGMPSVSTRLAGIPEIVRHGETGLLVPVGDEQALTEALRRLALDAQERRALGDRARAHVAREYDAGRNAARLLDVIRAEVDSAHAERRVGGWRKYS